MKILFAVLFLLFVGPLLVRVPGIMALDCTNDVQLSPVDLADCNTNVGMELASRLILTLVVYGIASWIHKTLTRRPSKDSGG